MNPARSAGLAHNEETNMVKKTENKEVEPVAVNAEIAAEKPATHRIAATPAAGFWRAGRYWPRDGVEVAQADFSEEQWAAIEAEPKLVVKAL